ncbi:hypothetical protein [Tahibacter sp.]|uniref:hypothetical protein n=1 Tax=Tahibacter sp. TaxID=2056211 RepID=UPI002D7F648E|nr:hypothetical protein [Tahibacter sp.]
MLVDVRFDWAARSCRLDFAGSALRDGAFSITFTRVSELVVPALRPWGPSSAVLEANERDGCRYEIVMQSGDTIVVVADGPPSTDSIAASD